MPEEPAQPDAGNSPPSPDPEERGGSGMPKIFSDLVQAIWPGIPDAQKGIAFSVVLVAFITLALATWFISADKDGYALIAFALLVVVVVCAFPYFTRIALKGAENKIQEANSEIDNLKMELNRSTSWDRIVPSGSPAIGN